MEQQNQRPNKGFKKGTCVLMYDGSTKSIETLVVGDLIMGDDSTPRKIIRLYQGFDTLYKITYNKTDYYYCTANDVLCLQYNSQPMITNPLPSQYKNKKILPRYRVNYSIVIYNESLSNIKNKNKTFTVGKYGNDIALTKAKIVLDAQMKLYNNTLMLHEVTINNYLSQAKSFNKFLLSYKTGVIFSTRKYNSEDISPYLLGLWLGDGTSADTSIANIDKEIIDYLYSEAEKMNLKLMKYGISYRFSTCVRNAKCNYFLNFLKRNNLINNKHIPQQYLIDSRENRLYLLAGLIDTDGYYTGTCYDITQKNKTLANNIVFLARSLGFWCHIKEFEKGTMYKGEMKTGIYQRIRFGGYRLEEIPVLLPRKKAEVSGIKQKEPLCYQIKITKEEQDYCYGFDIEGDKKRYLLHDFIVMR